MTPYQELLAAGCMVEKRFGDIYVKATPESRAIILRHRKIDGWNVQPFTSQIEGQRWYDIPFCS